MLDLSFETPVVAKSKSLDGPPIIVSGHGCRLTVRTSADVEGRNEDVLTRLYAVVSALHSAGLPGFATEPQEAYLRVHGGEPALYVHGEDQRGVITSIGKGLISGPKSVKDLAASLGVTALVEW